MCCKASVTTHISDPCLLWLRWPVKDAWEQLRLQLTGNVNTAFEEEVKFRSALSHIVVQPVLPIPSLEQPDLPSYYLVSDLLYSNKMVEWPMKSFCPVHLSTAILDSPQQRFKLGRGNEGAGSTDKQTSSKPQIGRGLLYLFFWVCLQSLLHLASAKLSYPTH